MNPFKARSLFLLYGRLHGYITRIWRLSRQMRWWGDGLARRRDVHRRRHHRSAQTKQHMPIPVLIGPRLLLLLCRLLQLHKLLPPLCMPVDLSVLVELELLVGPEKQDRRRERRVEASRPISFSLAGEMLHEVENVRGIWGRERGSGGATGTRLPRRTQLRGRDKLAAGIEPWLLVGTWMVVDVLGIERGRAFGGALAFLLPDPVDACTGVYIVVDRPIGALSTVSEGPGHFLEARVERKVVSHGVLWRKEKC